MLVPLYSNFFLSKEMFPITNNDKLAVTSWGKAAVSIVQFECFQEAKLTVLAVNVRNI